MQTPAPNCTDDGMLSSLNLSATGITVDRSIDLTVAEQAAATAQHATCLAHACKYTHYYTLMMICFILVVSVIIISGNFLPHLDNFNLSSRVSASIEKKFVGGA